MPALSLPPDPSVRRWSTDAVGPERRLDYWVGAICEAFLEMDCSSRAAAVFGGSLTSVPGREITFNQVRSSTQDVYRTPAAIGRGRQHPFYLITQLQTPWHVRQGRHLVQLRPGDAVLVDSAQTYELHFPESVACLSIQMPRGWVGRWLAQLESPLPRVAARDQGWGRALSSLSLVLGEDPRQAAAWPQELLEDHVGALLAAAVDAAPAQTRAVVSLATRAQDVLRQRLDEPGLCAADVAATVGVSVRTLHRAFSAQGTTFAGTLRSLRLARAAALLAQPRLDVLTSAEIGRRCGYADASHFGRDFQHQHGTTPARWRRARR